MLLRRRPGGMAVAAAILDGADTPEEISSRTGIRTGCTIECIQPILRLLEAAGIQPKPNPDGWQWYGETVTAWTMPEKVKQKYASRGFYFDEDRKRWTRWPPPIRRFRRGGNPIMQREFEARPPLCPLPLNLPVWY